MALEFKHWKIAENTYAIQNPGYLPGPGRLPGWGYVISYLLVGEEKALLQDTGYGNADLRGYVEAITDKPLIVVNSHIHPDHSGGNAQFDEIVVLEEETDSEEPVFIPQKGELARCQLVIDCGTYRFKRVPDGTVFDLGGRRVKAIRVEGHTRGAMTLLDDQTRFLFSGDSLLKRVLLMSGYPLSRYREALVRLQEHGGYDEIYSAHWYEPLGADFPAKMIAVIDDYAPEKTESAVWGTTGLDMVMMAHGNAFEDRDFCAFAFGSDIWDLMDR